MKAIGTSWATEVREGATINFDPLFKVNNMTEQAQYTPNYVVFKADGFDDKTDDTWCYPADSLEDATEVAKKRMSRNCNPGAWRIAKVVSEVRPITPQIEVDTIEIN